jgi:hypothetical protein
VNVSGGLETPTITMTYQKIGAGAYTFTVVGVTSNDVLWSDITGVINPTSATITLQTSGFVGAGDVMQLTGADSGVTYSITLKYEPTGSASYSLSLYVS